MEVPAGLPEATGEELAGARSVIVPATGSEGALHGGRCILPPLVSSKPPGQWWPHYP